MRSSSGVHTDPDCTPVITKVGSQRLMSQLITATHRGVGWGSDVYLVVPIGRGVDKQIANAYTTATCSCESVLVLRWPKLMMHYRRAGTFFSEEKQAPRGALLAA